MKAESLSLLIRRGSFVLPGISDVEKAYLGSLHHDPTTGKLRFGGEGAAPRGYVPASGMVHEAGKAPRQITEEEHVKMAPEASPSMASQGSTLPKPTSVPSTARISPPVTSGGSDSPYDVISSAPIKPQSHPVDPGLPSGHTFTMESLAHPQVRSSGAKPPPIPQAAMTASSGGAKPPPMPTDIGMASKIREPAQMMAAAKAIEGQQGFMDQVSSQDPMYTSAPDIHQQAARHMVMQMHHEQNGNYDQAKVHQAQAKQLVAAGANPQLEHFRAAAQSTENERTSGLRAMQGLRNVRAAGMRKSEKECKKHKEMLEGGLGDGKPDSDFDPKQLAAGMKVEAEHTPCKRCRKEITKDHLTEDKKYYMKLKKIEKSFDMITDLFKASTAMIKHPGTGMTQRPFVPTPTVPQSSAVGHPRSSGSHQGAIDVEFTEIKPKPQLNAPKPAQLGTPSVTPSSESKPSTLSSKPSVTPPGGTLSGKPKVPGTQEDQTKPTAPEKPGKSPKGPSESPGRGSAFMEGMGYGGAAGSDVGLPGGGMAPIRAAAGLIGSKVDLASWQAARGSQSRGPLSRSPLSRSILNKFDLRKSNVKLYIGL